jgi:hypothetical protein
VLAERDKHLVDAGLPEQVADSAWGEASAAYTGDNDGGLDDQIYLTFGIVNSGW